MQVLAQQVRFQQQRPPQHAGLQSSEAGTSPDNASHGHGTHSGTAASVGRTFGSPAASGMLNILEQPIVDNSGVQHALRTAHGQLDVPEDAVTGIVCCSIASDWNVLLPY